MDYYHESYVDAAIELGFKGTKEQARKINSEYFKANGKSVGAFLQYGIDEFDLFDRAQQLFMEHTLPKYKEEIKQIGREYLSFLSRSDVQVAILSHGSTKYVQEILDIMGIPNSVIPSFRVIGFEQYNFQLKSESKEGYNLALGSLGLSEEDLKKVDHRIFFADDYLDNLRMAKKMGFNTVYTHSKLPVAKDGFRTDFYCTNIREFFDLCIKPLVSKVSMALSSGWKRTPVL